MRDNPIALGSFFAIAAALLFGFTTPLLGHFGQNVGTFATAALLYAGAAMGSTVSGARAAAEPAMRRRHVPRLFLVALFGAVLAPAALVWGLRHVGALTASLLLNLEAVFTVVLARAFYRELLGRRVLFAMVLMVTAGVLLALRMPKGGVWTALGVAAVAAAALGWALDNTLTRPLADIDPRAVVFWKGIVGATMSALAALLLHERRPTPMAFAGLLACGATGYGFSLRLYLRAQRTLGAARTGSLFALAPFVGAAVAFAFGDRGGAHLVAAAAALFAIAVYLHVTEAHGHVHRHEALEHEHAHTHDDGHHLHTHEPPVTGSHSHVHRHETIEHEHAHGSDLHHRHRHG